ncbi:hypothetical protein [Cellulophaga sp. E6(2014)]|uniref:hypothetical protein n=1 Tax=Cellulophaga sp. E6(2014) TaxID=1495334 RepID=UPI00051DE827|nr:hypothetical protein [Cellulophaga sp. E6(2014)]KGK31334.1 hypothetical protein EL45_04820 [Cellulophaga sp. E6(2014)]
MKKYYFIGTIILFQLLFACKNYCTPDITGLNLTNSIFLTAIDSLKSVDADSYRIQLRFNIKQINKKLDKDCFEGEKELKSNIQEIRIVSNTNIFNTLAGEEINLDYFRIYDYAGFISDDYGENIDANYKRHRLSEWIEIINKDHRDKYDSSYKFYNNFYIEFFDKNQSANNVKFKLILKLMNGNVFEAETKPIDIK